MSGGLTVKLSLTKHTAARIYFILILAIAPLYISNGYEDIIGSKTYFVWLSIVIGAVLSVIVFIKWVKDSAGKRTLAEDLRAVVSQFISSLGLMDVLVFVFAITCLISSCMSGYVREAFTGSMAWSVGGALLIALSAMYFLTSRQMRCENSYFYAMMIGGFFTMIIAILNDLWIDPLHIMVDNIYWKDHFTSTIGNINQFSGYLSIIIITMVMMFVVSGNGFKRAAAAIVLFFGYLNMFLTHADSIYVGVGFGYLFVIAYTLRNYKRYMGLLINGVLFGLAGFFAKVIILYRPEIRLDDISPILLANNVHLIIGGICFVLLLIHMALEFRLSEEQLKRLFGKAFIAYSALVVIGLIVGLVYTIKIYDMNFLNRRGFLWYVGVYQFLDNETFQQIFGIGPGLVDTISQNFFFEIEELYGEFYFLENLHNDVMEYLLTTGLVGCISYLGIYLIIIKDFIVKLYKNEDFNGISAYAIIALIAYIAQSIMNGPHPLMTAMYFALLAIYRGTVIEERHTNKTV